MTMRRFLAAVVLVAGHATMAGAETDLGAIGRVPVLSSVALSPSGALVATVRMQAGKRLLAVQVADTQQALGAVELGEPFGASLQWADEEHVLAGTATGEIGAGLSMRGRGPAGSILLVYDVVHHTLRDALASVPVKTGLNALAGRARIRRADGQVHLLVPTFAFEGGASQRILVRVDWSGDTKLVSRGGDGLRGWFIDASDNVLATEWFNTHTGLWRTAAGDGGSARELARWNAIAEFPNARAVAPVGDALWVTRLEAGQPVTRTLSLIDGKLGEPVPQLAGRQQVIFDRYTDRAIGACEPDRAQCSFFQSRLQQAWEKVVAAFPGRRIALQSWSDDALRWVVMVEDQNLGPSFVLADLARGKVILLGAKYEGLDGVAATRTVHYQARDGQDIEAFLTLPRGREAKALPLVVLVHPEGAMATAGFDWWSQALASQGYAVLQPNYRGSALHDATFPRGDSRWGGAMQDDLAAGVGALAAEGTIDPARVCIGGEGYGGFAALYAAAFSKGVYRCAVAIGAYSDLKALRSWWFGDTREESVGSLQFDRAMGSSGPADPVLEQLSPLRHAADVSMPVLLVHARGDTRSPPSQAESMAAALKKAGKPYRLVQMERAPGSLPNEARTIQEMVDFLRANNPP